MLAKYTDQNHQVKVVSLGYGYYITNYDFKVLFFAPFNSVDAAIEFIETEWDEVRHESTH